MSSPRVSDRTPRGRRITAAAALRILLNGRNRTVKDSSSGRGVVRAVTMRGGAKRGRVRLVSDAGTRGGNAWRPRIACSRGRVLAVWEDERDGPARLYYALGAARRLW